MAAALCRLSLNRCDMSGPTRLAGHAGTVLRARRCPPAPRLHQLLHRVRPCTAPSWPSQRAFSCAAARARPSPDIAFTETAERSAEGESEVLLPGWPDRSTKQQLGRLLRAAPHAQDINLTFAGVPEDVTVGFHALGFRDACQCRLCVSESSGQKRFSTVDIDPNPTVHSCTVRDDGSLEVVWADDFLQGGHHPSLYPAELIRKQLQLGALPELYLPARHIWDRATIERRLESSAITYSDWMQGGDAFAKAFWSLCTWGLIFVRGVPESEAAVQDIANKIGVLQSNFYGMTWDVMSKPDAENVAYTNEFLCLHQDLMYWHPVPKIQLLHCLKNDCEGGESLFSDGLRAAFEIKVKKPGHYRTLRTRRALFQYSANGHFYRRRHPVINVNSADDYAPVAIHWSPPFQGTFPTYDPTRPPDPIRHYWQGLPAWHKAARSFRDSLEAPENVFQYRMQPGDCVLFDNARILHGRSKFNTSSGQRHLRGGYLGEQVMQSTLTRLVREGRIDAPGHGTYEAERQQALEMYGTYNEKTPADTEQGPASRDDSSH